MQLIHNNPLERDSGKAAVPGGLTGAVHPDHYASTFSAGTRDRLSNMGNRGQRGCFVVVVSGFEERKQTYRY